jgi:hypothetical protein
MKKLLLATFFIGLLTSCSKEVTLPKNEYKSVYNTLLTADSININSRIVNSHDNVNLIEFTVHNKNSNQLLDSFFIGVATDCYSCTSDGGTSPAFHFNNKGVFNADSYHYVATINKSSQKAYCNIEISQAGYVLRAFVQEIKF